MRDFEVFLNETNGFILKMRGPSDMSVLGTPNMEHLSLMAISVFSAFLLGKQSNSL